MFEENKYTKWYMNIIDKANLRNIGDEKHHIIPKKMGGSNDPDNLVLLSYREHFICHLLLTKMCKKQRHHKMMVKAYILMCVLGNRGRLFETARSEYQKSMIGKGNSFYGKSHTDETKSKIKESIRRYYLTHDNPFKGKTHTDKSKSIMSSKAKERISVYGNPFKGKTHTDKSKSIMSSKAKERCTNGCKPSNAGISTPDTIKKCNETKRANGNWPDGGNNPNASPLLYEGIKYSCKKELTDAKGISRFVINKKINNGEIILL